MHNMNDMVYEYLNFQMVFEGNLNKSKQFFRAEAAHQITQKKLGVKGENSSGLFNGSVLRVDTLHNFCKGEKEVSIANLRMGHLVLGNLKGIKLYRIEMLKTENVQP